MGIITRARGHSSYLGLKSLPVSKLLTAKAESRVRLTREGGRDVRPCPVPVSANSSALTSRSTETGQTPGLSPPPLSLAAYPGAGRVVCRPRRRPKLGAEQGASFWPFVRDSGRSREHRSAPPKTSRDLVSSHHPDQSKEMEGQTDLSNLFPGSTSSSGQNVSCR